jgi:hypothetical protein
MEYCEHIDPSFGGVNPVISLSSAGPSDWTDAGMLSRLGTDADLIVTGSTL